MLLRPLQRPGCAPATCSSPCPVRSRSQLVCVAGKGGNKQRPKNRPQKPKKRLPSSSSSSSSSPWSAGSSGGSSLKRGMDSLLFDAMASRMREKIVDKRVPLFHEEWEAAVSTSDRMGLSPKEAAAVQRRVDDAWSTAHMMPLSFKAMFSDNPLIAVPPQDMAGRLGAKVLDEERVSEFMSAPFGYVQLKDEPLPYDPLAAATQSFSNTPCEAVHMLPGSTHVAIGFADLGALAAAVCRWGPVTLQPEATGQQLAAFPLEFDGSRDSLAMQADVAALHELSVRLGRSVCGSDDDEDAGADTTPGQWGHLFPTLDAVRVLQQAHRVNSGSSSLGSGGVAAPDAAFNGAKGAADQPLRWVGYDASAYAVAKAAVLLQMMRQGAATDSVLQVWYSSCWSLSTKARFLTALAVVLAQHSSIADAAQPLSPKVLQLLRHWQQQPDVSLAQSRSSWLQRVTKSNAFLGGFRRQQDRLALSRYVFTGELLAAEVGSTAMCSLPPGFCKLAADESFLQTIETATLARSWEFLGQPDIVTAGVSVLQRRIARLSELLQAGHVIAEVRHAAIQPDDTAAIQTIHALQPLSMSWSNVPDYWVAEDFHELARRCSAPATVHFLHCMNWVRETQGACWIDFILRICAAREFGDKYRVKKAESGVRELYETASQGIDARMQKLGVDSLILTGPVVDNPRNIIDACLHWQWCGAWLSEFMEPAEGLAEQHAPGYAIEAIRQANPNPAEADAISEILVPLITHRLPSYGPFARTSATIDLAFVQFGSSS